MSLFENAAPPAPSPRTFSTFACIGWIAAALLGLACLFFGSRSVQIRSEAVALRQESELLRVENQSLRQQLEAERIISTRLLNDARARQPSP